MAQVLVLALVVGATTAFAGLHKTVSIEVDGEARTVTTFGRTVGDVLATEGVALGAHDVVLPAAGALVADEGTVVVRRAREVVVEVDGEERTVWTTAETVGDVVAELGLRGEMRTSASRSAAVGRSPLAVATPKTVHVAADGTTTAVRTSALTVADALREAGVVLGAYDRTSVPLDATAVDGLVVLVDRVQTEVRSERTTQPFETVREDDPQLLVGAEVVRSAGVEGERVVTFRAHLVDGVEVGRTVLFETVVRQPVAQVLRVGTMTAPPPSAPVDPGTARAIALEMVLARGWGEDQFSCLDALWSKESGWNVTAENRSSGAYGIPQALPGSKMGSVADDWRTNATTQITWGLGYIGNRYGTPCAAWAHSQARNWY